LWNQFAKALEGSVETKQSNCSQKEPIVFLGRSDGKLFVSGFYLLAVFLALIGNIFSATPPLQLMTQSNLFPGTIQGLVAAIVGLFFVRKSSQKSEITAESWQ
jgi:hypothetical protein